MSTEIESRLDRILELMTEDILFCLDTVTELAGLQESPIRVTSNASVPLMARWWIADHPDGRYLHLMLRDANYMVVKQLRWRCVFRDPSGSLSTVERPS